MRVRIFAGHVVIGMITSNHHQRHERDMLDAICLEFRHDSLKIRPALYRIDIDILIAQLIEFRLDHGIIRIGYLRRTMRHNKDCIALALLRELGSKCLDGLGHIIGLPFLPLPVHQRSAQRHLLELFLVVLVDPHIIVVFHSRDDIEAGQCHAGVAILFELVHCLFRCRICDPFLLLDAIDDDMRRIGGDHFCPRMFGLNGLDGRVDCLGARVLEGGAKGHDDDGVLIRLLCQVFALMMQHTDFRSGLERHSRCLYL